MKKKFKFVENWVKITIICVIVIICIIAAIVSQFKQHASDNYGNSIGVDYYGSNDGALRNATRAYFCSGVTIGYGNADCILLENYDSNGNKIYGLIDSGRAIATNNGGQASTVVVDFLKEHGVQRLEFFCITHQHADHNGDAVSVINNFEIGTIYMKEFSKRYSPGGTAQRYENILEAIIDKYNNGSNIKVIGVSYDSLVDPGQILHTDVSVNYQEHVKNKLNANIRNNNVFTSFNKNNTKNIQFGSSSIDILNWEIYDENGNYNENGTYIPLEATTKKLTINEENSNSIVMLLKQGNKKALFTGDLNNLTDTLKNGEQFTGPEDRIKDQIGDVDFLKLGHHGYKNSNTKGFLNVLKPEYAIATNDVGGIIKETEDWLSNNNAKYMCVGEDEKALTVTIESNKVYLGYETYNVFKNINGTFYYIPQGAKYKDIQTEVYRVEYVDKNVSIDSWGTLKSAIQTNTNPIISMDNTNKICRVNRLVANISNNLTATETIEIQPNQFVVLKSSSSVKILRASSFTASQLFTVKGTLTLGDANTSGTLAVDGNNVQCTSNLINVENGILNIEKNSTICNNYYKLTSKPAVTKRGKTSYFAIFGSAIYSFGGNININGGSIKNNKQEIGFTETLPEGKIINSYVYSTWGTGIYMKNRSVLNMTSGEISGNTAVNNMQISTSNKYTYVEEAGSIYQRCDGVGIYAESNSIININGGRIINNTATNNSTLTLVKATNSTSQTNLTSVDAGVNGIGIYVSSGRVNISNATVSNNTYSINTNITKQENTKFTSGAYSRGYGVQVYIKDGDFSINNTTVSGGTGINNTVGSTLRNTCGGGLAVSNSTGDITNSSITNNRANDGGAIFATSNARITLDNTSITGNIAETDTSNSTRYGRGGGIFANANINLVGNTKVTGNSAYTGGGIYINSNDVSVYNPEGIISNNSSDNIYPESGIRNDTGRPTLTINKSTNELTTQSVDILIVAEDEETGIKEVTVNNSSVSQVAGVYKYTATANGTYVVRAKDYAGNVISESVAITNITVPSPSPIVPSPIVPSPVIPSPSPIVENIVSNKYIIDRENKYITRIAPYTSIENYRKNITANVTYKICNENGEEIISQDTYLATGNKFRTPRDEYILVVLGDVNGDGKVSITDAVRVNLFSIKLKTPTSIELFAADITGDGKISITDAVRVNLASIKIKPIE